MNSSRGFTLMEVLVASAILSIGAMALGSIYVNFNHQRRLEIQAVDSYMRSINAMEQLIRTPPSCEETSLPMVPVPGVSRLALVSISTEQGVNLRRLIPCR
ncbi:MULTISPECIES: PilW family protein [unclassified Fibrobacter]|uniref:PilW family protein n=1 Tax=unclassified Fibrobacter TaxID=2634177 RepID=UPI000D7AECE1|nr:MULTISPECIES: type II secretion system protein [unclassified Fibrobacter]PWJ68192.1 prepilin-type N-terminal cleavage/methylation domain-containing protein [Fibrobacter sp. UWR4]PZW72550.1 prepilin-type N-terminal cleavage/methylation domain-containing protein [Fibrobacter sp. UWR1]